MEMKLFKSLIVVTAMLTLAAIITGCSSGFVASGSTDGQPKQEAASSMSLMPVNGLVQSSEGGAVTLDVKWLPEKKEALAFQITMDTHSVDLDGYDLGKLAILKDDAGREYQPVSWEGGAGGHHRRGLLR